MATANPTVKAVLNHLLQNGGGISKVIEEWHEGTGWYRVWSSGLIEQGGMTETLDADQSVAVTFPIEFKSVVLNLNIQRESNTGNYTPSFIRLTLTGTTIKNNVRGEERARLNWYVAGY